jgi:hypothetical protein
MSDRKVLYRVLVVKHVGKRHLARFRSRWKDNINMDHLQEVVWGEWIGFIWLRKGTGGGHL